MTRSVTRRAVAPVFASALAALRSFNGTAACCRSGKRCRRDRQCCGFNYCRQHRCSCPGNGAACWADRECCSSRCEREPDPVLGILQLNALAAQRKAAQQELNELLPQQRRAEEMAERMRGLDARLLREWERLDALAYDGQRAKLREFNVAVTLWKRDHEPRFAIDWAFDLTSWGFDQDIEPWMIYTRESTTPGVPLANSSA